MADEPSSSADTVPPVPASRPPNDVLKFGRWNSRVDEEFWQRLAAIKLDALQLDDQPLEIQGFFAPCSHAQISNYLQLRFDSLPQRNRGKLDSAPQFSNRNQCPTPGTLYLTNTEEEFHAIDKDALLKKEAQKVWNDICSGRAIEDVTLLNRFFVISYADLKKWKFYYRVAFPALVLNPPATSMPVQTASKVLTAAEAAAVLVACQNWRGSPLSAGCPFFLLHNVNGTAVKARPLNEWAECQQEGGKVIFAFYDPCHLRTNPGWPLCNFLTLALEQWGREYLQVLCYRENNRGLPDLDRCLIVDITLSAYPGLRDQNHVPQAMGWEYDALQKKGPKMVDLASSMDPVRLSTYAADLNLKLMRWRLLPTLDMDLLSKTKCLLLGAGTLGCQVARGLMAWGIRHITLLDYGRVAMSNPVRQSLYTFDDCGKPKADMAAENLRRIFPGVVARGVQLAIPMPGHGVTENEAPEVMKACSLLQELVDEHDVIFLLTDTRESRWLPTLLCASANKIAVNAALGFDTFLVMRHGAGPHMHELGLKKEVLIAENSMGHGTESEKTRLGCYFCNDVVAPEDSTVNRTLDQQCTVTRPGVAPIAAALAVELTMSLLHHPSGVDAPADNSTSPIVQPLGILPHQIRGFAASFSQLLIVGNAFNKCTACSSYVVAEYQRRGFDFLRQVFNHPTYLEDLTGLTDLLIATKKVSIDWEDDPEEDSL